MDELKEIIEQFQNSEVMPQGNLAVRTKRLISLPVLTALGTLQSLDREVALALAAGNTPEEIREAVIQCTPYVGSAKALEALDAVYAALRQQGISLPLKKSGTVNRDTRLEKGLAAQYAIFGQEAIDHNRQSAPPELKHIQDYLSAYCFGDFYTREGIDLSTRELLTFCTLAALGGCEPQLKAHIAGNLQVGNNRETLLAAITWCVPYIGFPRTLNAIACINEIAKA